MHFHMEKENNVDFTIIALQLTITGNIALRVNFAHITSSATLLKWNG